MAGLHEAARLAGVGTRTRAYVCHGNKTTNSEGFELWLSCLPVYMQENAGARSRNCYILFSQLPCYGFCVICEHNSASPCAHLPPLTPFQEWFQAPQGPAAVVHSQGDTYTYMLNHLRIDFENRGNLSKQVEEYNCSEIQTDLSKKMSSNIHSQERGKYTIKK